MARCVFGPIRFQDSLIIDISGKNQLIPLSDNCQAFLFIYLTAFFIKYSRDLFSCDLFMWYLFIVVTLTGLKGVERWGKGSKIIMLESSQVTDGGPFLVGEAELSRHHSNYLKEL